MKKSVLLVYFLCSSLFAGDVIITPGSGTGSSDAAKLQGREISTSVPTASQALVWNDTIKQWVPTSVSVASTVSDTAYDATSWDGVTTFAPSKNAVRDKIETLVTSGGALGTPSSGTLTNATGLPIAGLTASTSTALGVGSIELGHATDTTITRTGSGAIAVEGTAVLLSGGALGTPSGGTVTNLTGTASININGTVGATTANTGEFTNVTLSGNQSAAAWTTSGLRLKGIAGTLTDTTSSGTVAAAYTNKLGGNTIAASSATTFTNYISAYFSDPVAGSNVTITNKYATGADSAIFGTSNPVTITNAGIISATSPALFGTPTAPTATAGTNTTQIATTAFVKAAVPTSTYRTILHTGGIKQQSVTANTSFCSLMNDNLIVASGSTFSIGFNPDLINILAADFPTVNGATTTMRVKVIMATNATAPTGNFTIGLYPITKAASSGGTSLNIYTFGSVISGSTVAFTTPAADTLSTGVSTDFAIPADGVYAIGVVTTATSAASSQEQINVDLQMKN